MSLASAIDLQQHDDTPAEDHSLHLGGSAWRDVERLLGIRGEGESPSDLLGWRP